MTLCAKDLMTQPVLTVLPEMTCEEVSDLFVSHHISGAPVVDKNGTLIGVISLFDLVKSHEFSSFYYSPDLTEQQIDALLSEEGIHLERISEGFVSDYMRRVVYTDYPHTPVRDLAKMMVSQKIHRVIIVEPDSLKPVGIVSTFDMVRLLVEGPVKSSGICRSGGFPKGVKATEARFFVL